MIYLDRNLKAVLTFTALMILTADVSGQDAPKLACPTLSIVGPPGILNPGNTGQFKLTVSDVGRYSYRWELEGADLEGGQGTPEITFRMLTIKGSEVKVMA